MSTDINYTKVADAVAAMKGLNDRELAAVVSSLSSDYDYGVVRSSTMGAMSYLFVTPADVYRNRKGSIRQQAASKTL